VLAIAHAEERILITNDADFGELVVRGERPHHGVILLRLGAGDVNEKTSAIERVLEKHLHELHEFIVVTRRGSRVRRPRSDRAEER
jgi:predicted nuclease of predicted toxin-antitoxin system